MSYKARPLRMTDPEANYFERITRAAFSCSMALSSLIGQLENACFMDSLAKTLGVENGYSPTDFDIPPAQLEAAYRWLFTNYDRIAAELLAARSLAEQAVLHLEAATDAIDDKRGAGA